MDVNNSNEPGVGGQLKLTNRLNESRSPYVRGHMKNPVAWQMWNPESLALAKEHNRLLFVSIGYAACHWCHVMERESFMSPEIADILNTSFLPIKIDREVRPDIDAIYMNYVQATTGSGGWPLNVFLTPDLEPVFGGTYWPGPNSATTTASATGETVTFLEILQKMRDVWKTQEEKCKHSAKEITKQLKEFAEEGVHSHHGHQMGEKGPGDGLEIELLEEAYQHFERKYDKTNGGFAVAPKFPTPVNLRFLLKLGQWPDAVRHVVGEDECDNAATMAVNTLRKMARGGIRDQIGYGFARYSVTADWTLPHFEKMLYDQAQLLDVYLDAFLITHDPEMLGAVYDIATYLTSQPLAEPKGGFYSSEDADSYPTHAEKEKHEGAFYVWTLKKFQSVLGDRDADVCARFYGVTADGNVSCEHDPHDEFIHQNVLKIASTPGAVAKELGIPHSEIVKIIKDGRRKLREYRERERPRPALDDKIVVAWNGLAIGALARTSAILEDVDLDKSKECLAAAEKAVSFIKKELYDADTGKLWRVYRNGRGDAPGFADDYAFLIQGLIQLYQATFNEDHLRFADTLQATQIASFLAPTGGFYTTPNPLTPSTPTDLLLRLKTGMDAAEPSANNISALNLYQLSSLLNDQHYATVARETVAAFEPEVEQWPFCFAGLLESVVLGRCGVRGVMILSPEEEVEDGVVNQPKSNSDEAREGDLSEKEILVRARANRAGTVVRVRRGDQGWLVGRNSLVKGLVEGKATSTTGVRVVVCEGGACREGVEFL